ncbi:TonB-dependent receptor plug domain-containing protein [Colwellia piezophila]|uniref:TonB-dependent receptor plug domain-containing protein n=1 Tax=Colwellia piezophila TaxID=211668 RepID=UPI00036B26B3|nr:TonB-dependent receptor [Colwellia piezophila]
MKYRSLTSLSCTLLLTCTPIAFGATTLSPEANNVVSNNTEIFTVTGTHIPDQSEAASLPKFTISAEDIAALAPNSFADVLAGVPGIDIFEQGGAGGLTFLSIRGGDPNFVVILIDGVKVNDPTNSRGGAFDLGTIDPAVIDKVDVYYGSFSTVYGSDALAGVVSIETKKYSAERSGTASVKVGSNGMFGGSVHLGVALADLAKLSVIGSFQRGDDSTFGDAFERQEIIASLNSVTDSMTQWNMGFFYAGGEAATFPEDSGGDRLAVIRDPETRDFTQTNAIAQVQHRYSDAIKFDLNSAWSKREEDISSPGIAPGVIDGVPAIDSISNYERLDISATASYEISPKYTIALGGAYAKEDGGMKSIIDFGFPVPADYTLKRTTESIFAEARLNPLESLHFTLGVRYDKADQIDVTTARLISRYQLSATSTISAQYSEGFKLPSFFAVAHPFVGNPELKPEQSKNYDVSIDSDFFTNSLTTRVSIYKNIFTDLVDFDPIAFTNVNRSKVTAEGIEAHLAYQANEQLSLSGQFTYNKMDIDEEGVVLRRRPEFKASFQVNYQPTEQLSLTGRLVANDSFYDSSVPTGMIKMPSYNHIDLSAAWSPIDSLLLRLHVKNILDNDKEQAVGFYNVGRSLTLSLSKEF